MAEKPLFAVIASLLLFGCSESPINESGDSGAAVSDAGLTSVDAGALADASPDVVTPDAMPTGQAQVAAPIFTPCATGWVEAVEGGITICKPWQGFDGPTCSGGMMRAPGQAVCEFPGSACPAGQWPEGLPTSGVLYVDPSASGQQSGAIDHPYATISQALAQANPGDTVALSKGTHVDSFMVVDQDVNIVGACSEESIVSLGHTGEFIGPTDYCELLFDHQAGHLNLRDLRLQDSFVAIRGDAGASLSLSGTSISHVVSAISGAFDSIEIEDSYITSQRSYTSEDCILATIALPQDGTVANAGPLTCPSVPELGLLTCQGGYMSTAIGFNIASGSTAPIGFSLRDSVVYTGIMEQLVVGASVAPASIQDSYFQRAALLGNVEISRSACYEELTTKGMVDASGNRCHLLLQGAGGEVHQHQGHVNMLCPGGGAQLTGSDIFNHGTNSNRTQSFYSGPCDVTLDRVAIDGTRVGITAHEGAQVVLQDVAVRDVVGTGSAPNWRHLPVSLGVYTGSEMSVDRFLLSGSLVAGAQLGPEGTLLTLSNGHVADNLIGVNVQAPGYDLGLLQDLVTWENNSVDIDAQDLQQPAPIAEFLCGDLADNDEDGKRDCEDPDCVFSPDCI